MDQPKQEYIYNFKLSWERSHIERYDASFSFPFHKNSQLLCLRYEHVEITTFTTSRCNGSIGNVC
jgi:hypothetical protein